MFCFHISMIEKKYFLNVPDKANTSNHKLLEYYVKNAELYKHVTYFVNG